MGLASWDGSRAGPAGKLDANEQQHHVLQPNQGERPLLRVHFLLVEHGAEQRPRHTSPGMGPPGGGGGGGPPGTEFERVRHHFAKMEDCGAFPFHLVDMQ